MTLEKKHSNKIYYAMIWFVVGVWGVSPLFADYMHHYYSASILNALIGFSAFISLLIICAKKLKYINKDLLKIAIPTGFINAVASLLQKIGLTAGATPSNYAFLENLSCVVVPILMFLFIGKKPGILKILGSIFCLGGCFVLSIDPSTSSIGFATGDILCAVAGVLYGFNIAMTGAFAKKVDSALFVLVHMFVNMVVSTITAFSLNAITIGGAPIEPLMFTFSPLLILAVAGVALLTNCLCWTLRTTAVKHIDATAVSVIMPLSAVVTSVVSIIIGTDILSSYLCLGAVICVGAVILCGIGDARETKMLEKRNANINQDKC